MRHWWFRLGGALLVLVFLTPLSAQMEGLLEDSGPVGTVDDSGGTPTGGVPGEGDFIPSHSGPIGRVDERLDNDACEDCFTVPGMSGEGRYQIFESVALGNTERVIQRRIPNPAPLAEGETRPTTDGDEDLWYIGTQAYSGPQDTDRMSNLLPDRTLIEFKRIHARKANTIMDIAGVHAFGINAAGFEVHIAEGYDQTQIPETIEGIPVVVNVEEMAQMTNHSSEKFRPVPSGAGIVSTYAGSTDLWSGGTLGPHIVRTSGGCCTLWSLTASHVVREFVGIEPPVHGAISIYQPSISSSNLFGKTTVMFQLERCGFVGVDTNCYGSNPITNWTTEAPDVAAIDPEPYGTVTTSPYNEPTGTNPTRHLQESDDEYTNGPSGIIRESRLGNTHRVWGAYGGRTTALVSGTNLDVVVEFDDEELYRFSGVHRLTVNPFGGPVSGDSGSAVTFKGTGKRHVAGVLFARSLISAWYTPASDIKTAFSAAGYAFSHYWGTKEDYRSPSTKTCDDPDGC